jgi:folylpolyglutamate synthase/dihydropteroate synthase
LVAKLVSPSGCRRCVHIALSSTDCRDLTNATGLYTSPHLCAVRERIRVNGEPLSEEEFAKYFFEVWERLEADPKVS